MQDGRAPDENVELWFQPRWTYISCVRKFLTSFFLIGLADKERAEQISMAASELLENAIKYASQESSHLRVRVTRHDGEIDLLVENPAEPQQINVLRRELALINTANPEELYLKRMEEAARTGGQSRLGLIRIRYDGGATLRLDAREREVGVHAIFSVEEA
jgi:hypothetical protein